ncbi:ABC transporter substrate-binding protein [Umezawaea beigongshangensis]|uniref:ABC transporter substrate-binding protein n=1 Tax=Umezawaea beigongshangensis TaxID=2780383 RepID=UPI0018F15288|nr:ABC transporter substrate-binding protein [Umezawaea beigongshangensis]
MRRHHRSTRALLGVVAAATLVLAGCSGGGVTAASDPNVLTVGMPNGPQTNNNNPFLPTSASSSLGYRYMIYETLAQLNMIKPEEEPTPWLAESWEWSPDYTKITFTTRSGVTWSDGEAFSAADVAYTFTLLRDVTALNFNGLPVASATATGDDTAEVTFTKPQFVNQWKIFQTTVVPEHVWSKVPDPATFTDEKPVGTGPYALKTFTPQTVALTVRDQYWQDLPEVPELQYTSYNDNSAQTTALANGTSQWSYVFMPNYERLFIAEDPANHKLWYPSGLGIHGLWFNTSRAPFDDVAVRRAVNDVIDRETIFVQGESKLYPKIDSLTGLPSPAGDSFLAPEFADAKHVVDVERAKQRLAAAGYTLDGDVLKDGSGDPVTFTLTNPAGWSDYLTDLDIVKNSVKQLGITAEVRTQTVEQWTTDFTSGEFDASMRWTNTGATPYEIYSNVMDGSQNKPVGEVAASTFGRFDDAEATQALADYAAALDDGARATALATLQKIMVEQVPMVPTSAGPLGAEYNQKHWVGWPSPEDPYAPPQPTQPNALQIVLKLKPANG